MSGNSLNENKGEEKGENNLTRIRNKVWKFGRRVRIKIGESNVHRRGRPASGECEEMQRRRTVSYVSHPRAFFTFRQRYYDPGECVNTSNICHCLCSVNWSPSQSFHKGRGSSTSASGRIITHCEVLAIGSSFFFLFYWQYLRALGAFDLFLLGLEIG